MLDLIASRRRVIGGATTAMASAMGGIMTQDAAAQEASPQAATPATRSLLSDNPLWERFGTRILAYASVGGAEIGEVTTTMQRIGDAGSIDDWFREWMATAERVIAIGDDSRAKGRAVSAGEAFFRASMYIHAARFPIFGAPVDPRMTAAYAREMETFQKAAALAEHPIEVVEIPYEGVTLPGYFVSVDDSGAPRPTVVYTDGYDGSIEEMYFAHALAAARRGYNILLYDGPGQGRNLIRDGMTIRPDWEHVVIPVIDWALARPDVDPDRVVLSGWSLGGFLAPRAAGVERRIAALVADPGQWDQVDAIRGYLPLDDAEKAAFPDIDPALLQPMEDWLRGPDADPGTRWTQIQRGLWVHGVDTVYDELVDLARFEVSSVAGNITCPAVICAARSA